MLKFLTMIVLLAGATLSTHTNADELDMRETAALTDPSAPQRGMTMQRVESKWGQPQRRMSPVGEPPITRWQYDGFVVYFEYDRVIHTVRQRG